ncbi:MAG: hypothetical protein GFH27_549323n6 [Chloroflexi bacterium AL-W]|nr:hypothetical protein [Chloroflexi bacterium AL-N1]NOK70157.1 hypothetical protein [Chloroflexi bacterium AL-N10]NOK77694.1 hypothetical protein [Chloroflexi bacterium AL-N5]NOK84703.1 hypothetical protein [Chloroflexi bacterium AL-W]NOK93234.1 hypothetical protein [Chloroflexi bacterium AL-N15]
MSKLAQIYQELRRQAARTGQDRAADLPGGARIAVRDTAVSVIVTFSRKGKKLGDVELITFQRVCDIPAGVERIPKEDQAARKRDGDTYHTVSYRWRKLHENHH